MSQFKDYVLKTLNHHSDEIAKNHGKNWLYQVVKPVIKVGFQNISDWLDKDPESFYNGLKVAKIHIDEAVKIYENEHKAKP